VELADAQFMLRLRTDPELSRLIHPTSPRLEDQQAYLGRYFETPGDYYFIVVRTTTGRPEGMVAIYDVDQARRQAEWGRWIMRHDSMGAPECALLVYRTAFEVLGLGKIYCRTAAANRNVVAFHTSCGLETNHAVRLTHNFGGSVYDAVEQYMTREKWADAERALDERARAVARLLNR